MRTLFFIFACCCFCGCATTNSKILNVSEDVIVTGENGLSKEIRLKNDTGAWRCSIDESLVDELDLKPFTPEQRNFGKREEGMHCRKNELFVKTTGDEGCFAVTKVTIQFIRIQYTMVVEAIIKDRSRMDFKMNCGRKALARNLFLIDPRKGPNEDEGYMEITSEQKADSR